MSLISFLKDAGEKMLYAGPARENAEAQHVDPVADLHAQERALEQAILDYMKVQGLPVADLTVAFDAPSSTVTVTGAAPDQVTREKIMLCCGNVQGVAHVVDKIGVASGEGAVARWYTVQASDSLASIAQKFYGDANQYRRVFDANRPMLSDPEQIYPGQVLRIPA